MPITPKQVILATISYADIFDYPLTEKEICYWSINLNLTKKYISKFLINNSRYIGAKEKSSNEKVYFIRGRRKSAELREDRIWQSIIKLKKAENLAKIYKIIPTVLFVGVTGGAAAGNANENDDIDLFFIVRENTMFTTRFFTTILTEIFSKRRRPKKKEIKDAYCLNMFVAAGGLEVGESERDLYTAHEIMHMYPIWERQNAYTNFLKANSWVGKFLPNAWKAKMANKSVISNLSVQNKPVKGDISLIFNIFYIIEPLMKFIQLWYMKKSRTRETINDRILKFHPKDAREQIKEEFKARLKKFNIPLDKIFSSP